MTPPSTINPTGYSLLNTFGICYPHLNDTAADLIQPCQVNSSVPRPSGWFFPWNELRLPGLKTLWLLSRRTPPGSLFANSLEWAWPSGSPTHTLAGLVKTSFMYSATVMGPVDLILYMRCRSIGVAGLFSTGSLPELKYFPLHRQGMTAKNTH